MKTFPIKNVTSWYDDCVPVQKQRATWDNCLRAQDPKIKRGDLPKMFGPHINVLKNQVYKSQEGVLKNP